MLGLQSTIESCNGDSAYDWARTVLRWETAWKLVVLMVLFQASMLLEGLVSQGYLKKEGQYRVIFTQSEQNITVIVMGY